MFLSEEALGATAGLINGLGNLGGFFGPMIVGLLVGQSGNTTQSLLFLGASFIVCGICVLLIRYKSRQVSEPVKPKAVAK
jgi:nitrate/nitrite transporter NarK